MVEQIVREYTEFVPDERIVSKAHAKVRFAGRTKDVANGPVFTWLSEASDGGTKLTFVILEEDLGWWQNLLESVSAAVMAKKMHSRLTAINTGVEGHAASAGGGLSPSADLVPLGRPFSAGRRIRSSAMTGRSAARRWSHLDRVEGRPGV